MITTKVAFDQKIDNIQRQLDVMHREDAAFKGYVNRQFEFIAQNMVTKEDLRSVERQLLADAATKDDLLSTEERLAAVILKIAEKLDQAVTKLDYVAEKVGVST